MRIAQSGDQCYKNIIRSCYNVFKVVINNYFQALLKSKWNVKLALLAHAIAKSGQTAQNSEDAEEALMMPSFSNKLINTSNEKYLQGCQMANLLANFRRCWPGEKFHSQKHILWIFGKFQTIVTKKIIFLNGQFASNFRSNFIFLSSLFHPKTKKILIFNWPILANFCGYFGQFPIFISGNTDICSLNSNCTMFVLSKMPVGIAF